MADDDDQRRGSDAGRGKRSVLRRGMSAVASVGRAMLPSSSSSRPTSLTPGVISEMSAEELIALVEDDERMLELIQDKGLKRKLRSRIEQLGDEGSLLPDEDEDANDEFSEELTQRIANFKDTATIWDHFAKDPARIETMQLYSTSKRNREVAESEDDPDREDSYDGGGTKRFAVNQSAAESSTQREKPEGRKTQSSQKSNPTTKVPEYFMPLCAKAWEIEKDPDSVVAIELFSRKRAMFLGTYCGLVNLSYNCFPESEVHGYMMKILEYILENGMMKVLPDVITAESNQNFAIDTKMEAEVQVAGSIFHRRVDVQISVHDVGEEDEIRTQIRKVVNPKTQKEDDTHLMLSEMLNTLLTGGIMTMLECKTPGTLQENPIKLINDFYINDWAPRNKEVAKEANPKIYKDFKQVINRNEMRESLPRNAKAEKVQNDRTIGSPVAQLCLYMISTAVNFGALTNGPKTYFFRLDSKARTVKVSGVFYSNRNDNEDGANPGNWSLCQAWLVFLYHALKDHKPTRAKDFEWLKDGSPSTETTVNRIRRGQINVSAISEGPSSEGSSGASTNNSTSRNGNSRRASGSRNRGAQRNTTVFAAFRLGPNLETPNMRAVLGGKAVGYPDIMINGVSSFVKTTYALHDSAYALGHEGKVYAALHALQGDVVPRVTACGLDETLNLVVFATEQCGKSLCDLYTRELEEYGGLEELYWKAALALDKIHKAGFIHGDVALRNIVVDDASNVKFIDLERSKKSRSKALREEDFNLLADAFGIDSAKDFRTLSRTNNTEAHLENNEIVQ